MEILSGVYIYIYHFRLVCFVQVMDIFFPNNCRRQLKFELFQEGLKVSFQLERDVFFYRTWIKGYGGYDSNLLY